ncbi:hypothetical protein LINGRAHAP2_LOCUS23431 [Linum grandiflorum]
MGTRLFGYGFMVSEKQTHPSLKHLANALGMSLPMGKNTRPQVLTKMQNEGFKGSHTEIVDVSKEVDVDDDFLPPKHPCKARQGKSSLHLASQLKSSTHSWDVLGDFNSIRALNEDSGGSRSPQSMNDFNGFIEDARLLATPVVGPYFTWANKSEACLVARKLDRTLVNGNRSIYSPILKSNSSPQISRIMLVSSSI